MIIQQGSVISRLLALVVLIVFILAAYQFVFVPITTRYVANDQRIEQMSTLLQRYRDLEAAKPTLTRRLAEVRHEDETATSGFLEGESKVLTAASLQDRASQSVEAHGGNVISMQTMDPDEPGENDLPIYRMVLKMRLATTIQGLAAIVHDLETGVPYLFIEDLLIRSKRSTSRIRVGTEIAEPEPIMDVQLSIFGYVRDQATSPDESEG